MPIRKIKYVEPSGPNWAARAFAPAEAVYKAHVMENTWGHLAPKQGRKYYGFVLFAIGCFSDLTVIDFDFKSGRGKVLDSSPWLYEDLHDFMFEYHKDDYDNAKTGKVFRFTGTYMQSKDDGDYRFDGSIVEQSLLPKKLVAAVEQHGEAGK